MYVSCVLFFKQKTAYEMRISDWSSDVCSSDLLEIIGLRDPHAQDVRPRFADHLQRIDDIAEALGHFAALPVEREAVRQHRIIGRAAARAAAFEKRGLEPTAMLVRSEEHTSELQSLMRISYAVFCLQKKNQRSLL